METTTYTIDDETMTFTGPYTCRGSVRGSCGHKHRTIDAAAKCCASDQSGCRRHGGYSDRYIRDSAGQTVPHHLALRV